MRERESSTTRGGTEPMNETMTDRTIEPEAPLEYLAGVRLRESTVADDYKLVDLEVHVGDLVVVETASGTEIGEVRRPRRPVPEAKKDRLYRRVVRLASQHEIRTWRDLRDRE